MRIRHLVSVSVMIALLLSVSLALTQAQDTTCDPTTAFAQGQTLYAQGDYAGALIAYTCALQGRPDNAAIFNERGNTYRHMGRYAEAITDYNQAIELDATNANFFNNRGYAQYQQEAFDAALADFNQAITLDPNLAYAYNNRGLIYAEKGQIDAAAADFNQAIELNIDPLSWATTNLASLGLAAEPVVVSIPTAAPTLAPAPTAAPVVLADDLSQGQAAYKAGDYETAIAFYTSALETATDLRYFVLCERATAYYMLGDYEKAIVDYTGAIDLVHLPSHYLWRGKSYAQLGETEKAIEDYQSAILGKPDYMNAYLYSAELHVELLDRVEAVRDFKHWLIGQPQLTTVDAPAAGETLTLNFANGQETYAIPFEAAGGYLINAETSTQPDSTMDAVMILSSEGVPLAVDDDSGEGLNPLIADFSTPTDCSYTLYVVSQGYTGSVDLKLTLTEDADFAASTWPCWGPRR